MEPLIVDVTDATFEVEVMERSKTAAVIIDLWAPWCGPCKSLGPILETAVTAAGGDVVLAKVNVDENPQTAQRFRAQSIPAVHAIVDGKEVAKFLGAKPQAEVERFVEALVPSAEDKRVAALLEVGNEDALREALVLKPDHPDVVIALATMVLNRGGTTEVLALLERIPGDHRVDALAARARIAAESDVDGDSVAESPEATLDALLPTVKTDDAARQRFLDVLALMDPSDERVGQYRRKLTAALY